uniref:guanylate cyclase n=1 Tax=Echeneis naucrates TaxID=173247 RepID=A0A665UJ65_ECHNA
MAWTTFLPQCVFYFQYGFINSCLQSLVMEKFGQDTWDKLRSGQTPSLGGSVKFCSSDVSGISAHVFLKLFGEHFFIFCKKAGYDTMLRTLGGNLIEFIGNLDALHSFLALSYQEMNAPSFRVEMTDDGKMLLHYYSDRKGLHHIVPGIMEAVAREFFDSKVTMVVLNQSEEDERTGKKEHIVFLVNQVPTSPDLDQPVHREVGVWTQSGCRGICFILQVTFTIKSIRKFINSQFVLKSHKQSRLKLRGDPQGRFRNTQPTDSAQSSVLVLSAGQMLWMDSLGCMLYLCSPKLRSLRELQDVGLHLADLAQHDVTRDLVLLNQQRLEELRILSQHLEAEKQKTETLLYAMLPRHIANQLKDGKREFEVCTILFSDVVTFTNICASCEPIAVVHMLNSMYSKFDQLTSVHDVYKVETIGDAYMVVGGVPVPTQTHAHRVANFALGMRIALQCVFVFQIRVGLHTGPVLAGVVGLKMPRYCLFGDTVNTASRMESHGLPDHIHLSATTHRCDCQISNKGGGFTFQQRGQIEVKGKGHMTTYFLLRNLSAADGQLCFISVQF